jgi:phage I-like protein
MSGSRLLLAAIPGVTRRTPGIRLDAVAAQADGPVWVQIAKSGSYRGHPAGDFDIDEDMLQQLVRNLRNHPSYQASATDGYGEKDVIAWDFHHFSETDDAAIARFGSPAQGWVRDLEIRPGAEGLELWALVRWLPLAKQYIREESYHWASVAISQATDPVTGASIGWYLSSVALTNDPFIQGMAPLTASRPLNQLLQALEGLVKEREKEESGMNELLTLLAERCGIPADETRVKAAVLHKLEAGADADGKLRAILNALGVEDVNGGMAKITEMFKMVAALEEAMPELKSLREAQVATEEEDVEEDVEEAMKAHRLPAGAKAALRHMRTGGILLSKGASSEQLAARRAARAAFLQAYPPVAASSSYLTASIATVPEKRAFSGAPLSPPAPPGAQEQLSEQLESQPGKTLVEKAINLMRSQADTQGLPFEEIHRRACELARRIR